MKNKTGQEVEMRGPMQQRPFTTYDMVRLAEILSSPKLLEVPAPASEHELMIRGAMFLRGSAQKAMDEELDKERNNS